MLEVPRPLSLNEGRALVATGQRYFETVREEADQRKVAMHSLIMIARRVGHAIAGLSLERRVDFIVLSYSGRSKRGRVFGRTIDPVLAHPPADLAVVRPAERRKQTYSKILVPVDDGTNSRLAVELATDLGRQIAGRAHAEITLLRITPTKTAAEAGETELFAQLLEGIEYGKIETKAQMGTSVANSILEAAADFDLVIFGASDESPLGRLFPGKAKGRFSLWTAKRVLRLAKPTTIMVKRRPNKLRSLLQRVVLPG
jgi:nucleotide-binding universal stress UspA family protein